MEVLMKKFLFAMFAVFFTFSTIAAGHPKHPDPPESVEIRKKLDEQKLKRIQREIDAEDAAHAQKGEYTHSPVENRVIKITDRMIEMPQVITGKNSNDIVKKINFFNRKNNYPIFLMIDICYGGSVVGGEKIIRGIQTSKAKIYIVVKSFAASMAAVIASTFPENSYFLKNALILHHEISNGVQGNFSQHKDNVKMLTKWQEKLFAPIAARKGMTVEAFIKTLYEIKRDGDANLFAEEAVKEKWIFNTIDGIDDGSFSEKPVSGGIPGLLFGDDDQVDRTFSEDFYFMYSKVKIIEAK